MNHEQKQTRNRIFIALILFIIAGIITKTLPLSVWFKSEHGALWAEFLLFLTPYLIAGYDVLLKAARNSIRGHLFDENFLMSIATIGAFALVLFPDSKPHMAEGAAVMLFYQVGELFQSYAVGKSRASIAAMMDIAPEYATVERDGQLVQVDPYEVAVGDEIIIKPGERVPLDGVVIQGTSQLDTAALTGESIPREVLTGDEILSGCINLSGKLMVKVTKPYKDSTVSRILELVENAADKKARTENFITRFARYYTPLVVVAAVLLATLPPLLFQANWSDWIQRGLIFLVVSCPCALVISVPLSFFGGIGAASRSGILVKGGNYLEALASVNTIVFDKTGTLTDGSFNVVDIHPESGIDPNRLLSIAAHAEAYSNHPIALSIKKTYTGSLDQTRITSVEEQSGCGIRAIIDKRTVLVGNDKLMRTQGIDFRACELAGTILHVSLDGEYIGHIVIADIIKPAAEQAIEYLHSLGVKKTVMLTGDRTDVAAAVAHELGIDEYRAQLLPQDKVAEVETLLEQAHTKEGAKNKLAFVGDGINDAPVLTRADIGIAMGAMGSDAAIEAADIVLMDDKLFHIGFAIQIARKTMSIVWENIVFALGVKLLVLALAALGLANMWIAVFADVGVAVLAILNAMRTLALRPSQNYSSSNS